MKAALKKKWIAALRSGKYKQASQALSSSEHGERRYCCLGVLADICGLPWKANRNGFYRLEEPNTDMLPAAFADECGLGKASDLEPPSPHRQCATMNDAGHTFEEIAAWIEANL